MNTIAHFLRRICHVSAASLLLVAFFVSVSASSVQAGEGVSFSWRANPVEDEIVGYRLYYGEESRVAAGSYDFYIDFTTWQRCPADRGGLGCEPLPGDAVTCQDLFQEVPMCTVYDLQDRLYFAMTAYNAQAESDYTQELNSAPPDAPTPPKVLVALQVAYNSLLLH